MSKKTILIVGGVLLSFILIFTLIGINASNEEIGLRSQIIAQKEICFSFYDKLWKVLEQKAQVSSQYKDAFKEIYPELIQGRYGNEKGGTLLKMITESNPNFDVSLYKDLMHWLRNQLEQGATHIEITQDYVGNTLTTSMKFKEN